MLRLALSIVTIALIPLGVLAQSSPPIGAIVKQSPADFNNIKSGCVWRYNMGSSTTAPTYLVDCATRAQLYGTPIRVTLTGGNTLTTVSNSTVTASNYVTCGCDGPASGAVPSCNPAGRHLAEIRVRSTSAGSFEIQHGYALGNEVITCVIE